MTSIMWSCLFDACVFGAAWKVSASLRRRERARTLEARRRNDYRRCAEEERQRKAAEFEAETLALEEAEMARLVEWYRMTEGTGDARSEGS